MAESQWRKSGCRVAVIAALVLMVLLLGQSPDATLAAQLPDLPSWTAEVDQAGAWLGITVAGIGDVNGDGFADAAACAKYYDFGGVTDRGAVFVFHGSAAGLSSAPNQTILGEHGNLGLCSDEALGTAGDVNGDGFDDLVVSSRDYNGSLTGQGKAYLFLGSASGLSASPDWSFVGEHENARLGRSVSTAGDVNGDGFDDVIVGAYYYDSSTSRGRAYAFYGSAAGLRSDGQADWMVERNSLPNRTFGNPVSNAGDVNGDGFDDVIIGDPEYSTSEQYREGAVVLYLGSASGLETTYAWLQEGNVAGRPFGNFLGSAGDVNNDGYDDIIVGHSEYSGSISYQGRAYVFYGCAPTPGVTPAMACLSNNPWITEGDQFGTFYGAGVGGAGDINADGYDDVIVGAYGYEGGTQEGAAYVYYGSAAGLIPNATWFVEGGQVGSRFGQSVAGAGDINGDGLDDVVVGSPLYDGEQSDEGRVYAFYNDAPFADPNGPYLGSINQAIAFDGSGSADPDGDSLTYSWMFGDSSTGTGVTPGHAYATSGIFDVCLTVNDGVVNSEAACTIAVVYDPEGGFVTGGGWIDSPVGAYLPDPEMAGKATFGFVSKYNKGASVPTGSTEFQFRAADLNFHSESYDWLVVTGSSYARFKGLGTINGAGAYKFLIWAGDGIDPDGADTFRIKIWTEDVDGDEIVVYDNGMDQAISGGSIVVHTK